MNPNPLARRSPAHTRVISVRPMTSSDLEALRQPSARTRLKSLRDAHHIVARCLASGMSQTETAARVGYTPNRISILTADPAMAELIAKYRDLDTDKWLATRDEFHIASTANMLKAERMISDKLDTAIDDQEPLPLRELIALTSDRADRFGYGKHSTQTNINVDFAAKLEAARRRIDNARSLSEPTS